MIHNSLPHHNHNQRCLLHHCNIHHLSKLVDCILKEIDRIKRKLMVIDLKMSSGCHLASIISQTAYSTNNTFYYFAIILYLPEYWSNPWYLSLKPDLVTLGSDLKCIRTLLVEDFWLFGIELPQYLPINEFIFASPSYNIK